jgi:hypothetical protein
MPALEIDPVHGDIGLVDRQAMPRQIAINHAGQIFHDVCMIVVTEDGGILCVV